jgi:hypothetical protein
VKASVYTSLFNYSPDKFDLLGAFKNWSKYADEIVIATFEDQEDKIRIEVGYVISQLMTDGSNTDIYVVSCSDTSLDDPLFDGKLKNAALQACSNELVYQQDLDERISGNIEYWEQLGRMLLNYNYPITCSIPVIDLYKDYSHYKGVNSKWFFHKKTGIYRGPVNFAKRPDGTINTNLSDSCEAVLENGDLAPYFADHRFIDNFDIKYPLIIHLGYLDLNKRIDNNKFWQVHWTRRNGSEVEVATTLEKLEEENEAKPHGLPIKWWEK